MGIHQSMTIKGKNVLVFWYFCRHCCTRAVEIAAPEVVHVRWTKSSTHFRTIAQEINAVHVFKPSHALTFALRLSPLRMLLLTSSSSLLREPL